MSAALDRLGPLSGAAFALLFGVGSALTLVGSPALGGPPNEIRTYFLDQEQNIYVGGVLSMLSVPFLIWFTAYVRSAIVQHERSPRLLSTIAFGSGVAASAVVAAEVMALTVGAIRVGEAGDISSDTAAVLFDLSTGIGGIGVPVTLAAMQLAFAAAALRYRQLAPAWFARGTIVIGVLGTIIPFSSAIFFVTLLWLLVVSVLLFLNGRDLEPD